MHSAPHRNNSDFQLKYFIAGSCHTADGAWNLLYEQKMDAELRLNTVKAGLLRREARRLDLIQEEKAIQTEQDRLRYEANKLEFDIQEDLIRLSKEGVERELATILRLMDELEPHRKYKNLPLLEATDAAQQDEWREEFKHRIENYMVSQGTVPHDQLEAMRKHPDFSSDILPHLKKTMIALESATVGSNAVALLAKTELQDSGDKSE